MWKELPKQSTATLVKYVRTSESQKILEVKTRLEKLHAKCPLLKAHST